MTWAIVPVKDMARAKQRLAGVLSPEQRRRLSHAMLEDVLGVLAGHAELRGTVVVSSDPAAQLQARRHGARLIDDPGGGLNEALEHAATTVGADGQTGILIVPGDAPLVSDEEIEALLAARGSGPQLILAPDRRGDGTNALLCAPSDLISFHYGPGSFAAHASASRSLGIEPTILDLPGLALDIDTPEDLAAFVARARRGATCNFLRDLGFSASNLWPDPIRKVV